MVFWLLYGVKLISLVIGVAFYSAIIESILEKKLYVLYILAEIAVIVIGIWVAAPAAHKMEEVVHPGLALVGVIWNLAGVFVFALCLFGRKNSVGENPSDQKQDSDQEGENDKNDA